MKALVLEEYSKLVYRDVEKPVIKNSDDILIKVKAASVCGSDVHGLDGSTGRRKPPVVMGHEASGEIADIGSGVKRYKKGDRVIFNSTLFCGACDFCLHGNVNLCDERKVFGVSCDEYKIDGAYAEYIVVPERIVYPIPGDLSYQKAALIEPLSVGFHAVRMGELGINDSVLVIGAGTIGSFVIQSLKLKGAGRIIVADIDDEKLELAKLMGADYIINSGKKDFVEEALKISPDGIDIVFDIVGKESVTVKSLDLLKKNGKVVMVGLFDANISFPIQKITTWQYKIIGSYISGDEYPACLALVESEKINLDPFINNYVPLSEAPDWFERLHKRESGLNKVIFNPEK